MHNFKEEVNPSSLDRVVEKARQAMKPLYDSLPGTLLRAIMRSNILHLS